MPELKRKASGVVPLPSEPGASARSVNGGAAEARPLGPTDVHQAPQALAEPRPGAAKLAFRKVVVWRDVPSGPFGKALFGQGNDGSGHTARSTRRRSAGKE